MYGINGNENFTTTELDLNGDGIVDAVQTDYDGDGIAETLEMDTNGDNYIDTVAYDTDIDGSYDHFEYDTNGDFMVDTIEDLYDTDGNGIDDVSVIGVDTNGDTIIDTEIDAYDTDGDSQFDYFDNYADTDGDTLIDMHSSEQLIDSDIDGEIDTYIYSEDTDVDGDFDLVEVYDYDAETGMLTLIATEGLDQITVDYDQMSSDQFNPQYSDLDKIVGDPEEAMQEWEFQGNTGRCAIYSQKFIIEEFTGMDLDIEELADISEENGWFTEESGTSADCINKLLDYYGIENEMSYYNDISDIEECLNNDGRVIVSLDSGEIWYGEEEGLFIPDGGADHAVEVIGIDYSNPDEPMVILNDSGTPDGCGEMVPLDVFVDAWDDGCNQMVVAYDNI